MMGCAASNHRNGTTVQTKSSVRSSEGAPLGMHITAIRRFLADHPEVESDNLYTSQINRQIVKPETTGTGRPYINLYDNISDADSGKPFVAPATVYISHAWRYSFCEVVVDVMEQHAKDNPDSYFWFDLFTNDQNSVAAKDFNDFFIIFMSTLEEIGELLLILSPWNDPIPLKRAWCLVDISHVLRNPKIKLEIRLPQLEEQRMAADLVQDKSSLVQALSDIQAEKAQAFLQSDKDVIFEFIEKSEGGFAALNQRVKGGLREWYVKQFKQLIAESPHNHLLILACSQVMIELGFLDDALKYGQQCESLQIPGRKYRADVFDTLGKVYFKQGNYDNAMENLVESLALNKSEFGDSHPDVASSLSNIGDIYIKKGDYEEALEYHNDSLRIRKEALGENSLDVALSYLSLGDIHASEGKLNKAFEEYNEALSIRLRCQGENHPDIARTYHKMSQVCERQDQLDKALEYGKKCHSIILNTLGGNHPDLADALTTMGNINCSRKDFEQALKLHTEALDIRTRNYGDTHPSIADSYHLRAVVYKLMGDSQTSLDYHRKSLNIRVQSLGEDHPDTASTFLGMADTYKQMGKLEEAIEYYDKAAAIKIEKLGDNHPELIDVYKNMGLAYMGLKNYTPAVEFLDKSLDIAQEELGPHHSTVEEILQAKDGIKYASAE